MHPPRTTVADLIAALQREDPDAVVIRQRDDYFVSGVRGRDLERGRVELG